MGARVYNPYTGTFTQPDPIQGGGLNAYGYANGDPVNETDLTGDCGLPVGCLADAGGAILGAGEDAGGGLLDLATGAGGVLLDVGARGFGAFALLQPLISPSSVGAAPCEMNNDCGVVFAKQQPKTKSQEEIDAQSNRAAGVDYDEAAAKSGDQKDVFNEKAAGTRNKNKQRP
jgi:uncharacterized protein RhaS with RHS repeats